MVSPDHGGHERDRSADGFLHAATRGLRPSLHVRPHPQQSHAEVGYRLREVRIATPPGMDGLNRAVQTRSNLSHSYQVRWVHLARHAVTLRLGYDTQRLHVIAYKV